MTDRLDAPPTAPRRCHGLAAIVGFLVCVELASGILQGYYTPIFSDIADHLVDPRRRRQLVRGRAADRVGARACRCSPGSATSSAHKKVLLLSTAVTALGSWILVVRAVVHDVPDRLGDPGRLRRVAAARGRDRLPAYGGPGRQARLTRRAAVDPGRGARAVGDHRRAHQRRPRRPRRRSRRCCAAGDRGHRSCFVVIWFGIEDAPGTRDRRHRLARPRADHPRARAGDGGPDR